MQFEHSPLISKLAEHIHTYLLVSLRAHCCKLGTERGPERPCRINKQRELTELYRQGTQQQRPESPTITPSGMRVNTGYKNSTEGTSSKTKTKTCLPLLSYPPLHPPPHPHLLRLSFPVVDGQTISTDSNSVCLIMRKSDML